MLIIIFIILSSWISFELQKIFLALCVSASNSSNQKTTATLIKVPTALPWQIFLKKPFA